MPRESKTAKAARAQTVLAILKQTYPDAHCALNHNNAFELLIATILSAQCTDARVNMVTPELFKRYPTPQKMAQASQGEIEALVRTTGFYRNKAKNILASSRRIVEEYQGQVPAAMDDLLSLAGVARKTANVVLGNAFGKNVGMVVDTHIGRLSKRLGFTSHTDPVKIEKDMMAHFPQDDWTLLAHLLISHGRAICQARKPDCPHCPLAAYCPKIGVKTIATQN